MPDLKSLFTKGTSTRNGIVEAIEAGNICRVRVGKNVLRIRSQDRSLRVGQSVVITTTPDNKKYIIAADKNQQRSHTEVYING